MTERSANENKRHQGFAGTVVENSWVGSAISRAASKGSGVVESVTDYVKESYLYRWLTKEPEPSVVVIDLRETYTVGPFIRLLDAIIEWLQPYWEASALKRVTDACIRSLERAAATKPGRVLASILAPPEPPARTETQNDHAGEIEETVEDTDDEREQTEGQ